LGLVVDREGLQTVLCQSEAVQVAVVETLLMPQSVMAKRQSPVLAMMGATALPLRELIKAQEAVAVARRRAEMEPQAWVGLAVRDLPQQSPVHLLLMPVEVVAGFARVHQARGAQEVEVREALLLEQMEPQTLAVAVAVAALAMVALEVQAFSF
tara:strand:+ start:1817 stop:2278 length:462 start_codon:yes stop_codon:yes gene_type:complete